MVEYDRWARWLIETRFGGDAEVAAVAMGKLYAVRDQVLDRAHLADDSVVLDVGAGDGLIAFGALERIGSAGHVILSDISQPLLEHSRTLAEQMGYANRCTFVQASASDLHPIAEQSVDVVTTRSVLIYVSDKAAALREFYRVLRPGGRMSLFEPINNYKLSKQSDTVFGYDQTPVVDLEQRLWEFYRQLQPDTDPMLDFDERDLVRYCEAAGFAEIHLELRVDVQPPPPAKWEAIISMPPNPCVPALKEVMAQLFTSEEAARYEAYARPRVEMGQGKQYSAVAYLWATKD